MGPSAIKLINLKPIESSVFIQLISDHLWVILIVKFCDEDDNNCDYCRREEDAAKQANSACADTQSALWWRWQLLLLQEWGGRGKAGERRMRRHPVSSVMKMTAATIAGVRRTRQSRRTTHAQTPSQLRDEDDSCSYCRSEEDAAKQANGACADTQLIICGLFSLWSSVLNSCDYCRSEEDAAKQANSACADTQSAPFSSSTVCPECGKEARDINRHIRWGRKYALTVSYSGWLIDWTKEGMFDVFAWIFSCIGWLIDWRKEETIDAFALTVRCRGWLIDWTKEGTIDAFALTVRCRGWLIDWTKERERLMHLL